MNTVEKIELGVHILSRVQLLLKLVERITSKDELAWEEVREHYIAASDAFDAAMANLMQDVSPEEAGALAEAKLSD